jgi:molecular chaperone HscB
VRLWRVVPRVNLQSNDFELFGVPQQFAQHRAELDDRWKALQREAHPDKFATQGAAAQRVAMQYSVRINEAYQRLKDPLRRAAYLCELGGAPIQAHSNTAMPAAFLMQQMEWREALDEAGSGRSTGSLAGQCGCGFGKSGWTLVHASWTPNTNLPGAVLNVRALMFIEKFARDLERAFDKFD